MKRLNLFLLAALALSVGANLAVRNNPARPHYELLPEMVRTAAYDSFAPNPNFPDGKTLQAAAAGTIARGAAPLRYTASAEDAVRAGKELQNPWTGKPGAAERGAAVYAAFCLPCHGATGKGDGPVSMRGYPPPPPFSAKSASMPDGRIFHILTYGQKNMPPYAGQISRDDRWKAILHVRSLQQPRQP
jgi:mono/diheme cytochrome c family protein